jgi:hypothetical protein
MYKDYHPFTGYWLPGWYDGFLSMYNDERRALMGLYNLEILSQSLKLSTPKFLLHIMAVQLNPDDSTIFSHDFDMVYSMAKLVIIHIQ